MSLSGGLRKFIRDSLNKVVPNLGTVIFKHPVLKYPVDAIDLAERQARALFLQHTAKAAIIASKKNALQTGPYPIPENILSHMTDHFCHKLLESVRYVVDSEIDSTLQALAFHIGDKDAITLENVIVFRRNDDALNNIRLWAHELVHVRQYRSWGNLGLCPQISSQVPGC